MKISILLLALLPILGCAARPYDGELPPPNDDFLSDATRQELQLPAKDFPMRSNDTDEQYAVTLPPDIKENVDSFLKVNNDETRIGAARPIGNYLLLWVYFYSTVADGGGADLIYSIERKKVVGYFCGGEILG